MIKLSTPPALENLWETSVRVPLEPGDRWVIFSDLHMGDGSRLDDFHRNAELFLSALTTYYLPRNFKLLLNGDVEEILRFRLGDIKKYWKQAYDVFDLFHAEGRLFKLEGNHDPAREQKGSPYPILPSLTLTTPEGEIFFLHGHQAGRINSGRYNRFLGALLKIFANPLGIKNISPAYHKKARYEIERRVYEFAKEKNLLAVIGHTHRPLFESRSKSASLEARLDVLCRRYARASSGLKKNLAPMIRFTRLDWEKHRRANVRDLPNQLYNREFLLPCLFNSGTILGRGGLTGIEITAKKIRLVHWADLQKPLSSKVAYEYETRRIFDGRLTRTVLKKADLNYLFTLIQFLA